MKLSEELKSEVDRLLCLNIGRESEHQIMERLRAIAKCLLRQGKIETARKIIDRCIERFEYIPLPSQVERIASEIFEGQRPVWKITKKVSRTVKDIEDKIAFQEEWIERRPSMAAHALARLDALRQELAEALEVVPA